MRYIVKSHTDTFSGLRVLAESAAEAVAVAQGMIDRDVPEVTIYDADGESYDIERMRGMAEAEAAASDAELRHSA